METRVPGEELGPSCHKNREMAWQVRESAPSAEPSHLLVEGTPDKREQ